MAHKKSICSADCTACPVSETCGGCIETCGRPFGEDCMIAECCKKKGLKFCAECEECECALKKQLIAEFNALGIQALPEITELYALKGSFVNLTYDLPNGQQVQLLKDDAICLGNQLPKDGERCYGICTDGNYLIVCEYGENGVDPEIILYKKRGM